MQDEKGGFDRTPRGVRIGACVVCALFVICLVSCGGGGGEDARGVLLETAKNCQRYPGKMVVEYEVSLKQSGEFDSGGYYEALPEELREPLLVRYTYGGGPFLFEIEAKRGEEVVRSISSEEDTLRVDGDVFRPNPYRGGRFNKMTREQRDKLWLFELVVKEHLFPLIPLPRKVAADRLVITSAELSADTADIGFSLIEGIAPVETLRLVRSSETPPWRLSSVTTGFPGAQYVSVFSGDPMFPGHPCALDQFSHTLRDTTSGAEQSLVAKARLVEATEGLVPFVLDLLPDR